MSERALQTRARAQLLLAALLFSTGGAAIKAASLTAPQIAGFRSGVAAVAVLLLARAARSRPRPAAIAVGLFYAATVVLFVLANRLTTAANTIFLQSTAPIYVLLASPWLLGERIGRRQLVVVAVAAAGLSLFMLGTEPARSTAPDPARGNLLAIVSGVTWAGTVVGLRRMARGGAGSGGGAPVHAVVIGNLLAFAICAPWAFPFTPSSTDLAVLAYLGVFQIALPYLAVGAAMRHVSALEASLILMIEPVLNPLWAFLLHDERPGPFAIVGGAILIGATLLQAWLDRRAAP